MLFFRAPCLAMTGPPGVCSSTPRAGRSLRRAIGLVLTVWLHQCSQTTCDALSRDLTESASPLCRPVSDEHRATLTVYA